MKLLRLLTKAKTVAWPGGEAWKVKEALLKKYRPDDVLTVSELKKRLNNVSMKANQDPSDMFEELAAIEHAYSSTAATLGDQDLIGAVFAAAPEKYHTVLGITADIKGEALEIEDFEKAMYNLWRQGGGKPSVENKDNELVLGAFAGTCYVCKNQGHKATDCPSKNKGGGGGGNNQGSNKRGGGKKKFMGNCNNCGKFGHMKSNCLALEANKDKRPNGYRGTTEQVAAAVGTSADDEIEYVLCRVTHGVQDLMGQDDFVIVPDEISLYAMNLGDEYDDILMPDPEQEE